MEHYKVSVGEIPAECLSGYDPEAYTIRKMIAPEKGDSTFFRMSFCTLRPKQGTPRHVHHNSDEGWFIVSGSGLFYADGKKYEFSTHDFLFAKAGVVHQLINIGDEELINVPVTAPPCVYSHDNIVIEPFDYAKHAL